MSHLARRALAELVGTGGLVAAVVGSGVVAGARREMPPAEAGLYAGAQVAGALAGVALANLVYQLPPWHASSHGRSGAGVWLGEVVATAGLLLVIGSLTRTRRSHLGAVLAAAVFRAARPEARLALTQLADPPYPILERP